MSTGFLTKMTTEILYENKQKTDGWIFLFKKYLDIFKVVRGQCAHANNQ